VTREQASVAAGCAAVLMVTSFGESLYALENLWLWWKLVQGKSYF